MAREYFKWKVSKSNEKFSVETQNSVYVNGEKCIFKIIQYPLNAFPIFHLKRNVPIMLQVIP